ncbi:MAG: acylneuraminate cytidylyltransferase family protein [Acidimicrobiia bacterium]|nr:acylneuraminate cytidylyltransferase family protein [Actinomycetota bacterium]NBY57610.1 acylneuraminate cytidylyltransferase family protein [Actinomycetota bacterium]NDC91500.1 acylneuraminate cytidylyltransferase family protein [Acidimicrobiia bacterium]
MRRLAVICARAGSKGVPNKNLRLLGGVPLIVHTIRQAQACSLLDNIAVSSDSEEILKTAEGYGIKHLIQRPTEMATDVASKVPAIRHCVQEVEKTTEQFDLIADLDCTVPFRLVSDIVGAFELIERRGVSTLISGTTARKLPYFNIVELTTEGFVRISKTTTPPLVRRQDSPPCFDMNASIHIWRRQALFSSDARFHDDTVLFEMPLERSIDIDTEIEFVINELLMKKYGLI